MSKCDFLLIQEHCLYKSQFHKFGKLNQSVSYCGSSAMDESKLLFGRPFGGTAIIWKMNLKHVVNEIQCNSDRLCCISCSDVKMLIFNVYMPCDGTDINKYKDILDEISYMVLKENPVYVVIGGDFNTAFARNRIQTKSLCEFISEEKYFALSKIKLTL